MEAAEERQLKVDKYEVRGGLMYTKEHEWLKLLSEGRVVTGVTDYGAQMLHDVVYVVLPQIGTQVKQMEAMGSLESIKAVADLYCPVSGRVVKVNKVLETKPELVNQSPYDEGWVAEVEVNSASLKEEMARLMDAAAYASYLNTLVKGAREG